MKPVGTVLLAVCLLSLVVAAVVLTAPEVSPVWTIGSLALAAGALLVTHGRSTIQTAQTPPRERLVFQKVVRVKDTGIRSRQDIPDKPREQHEILLRVVDARGLNLNPATSGSNRVSLSPRPRQSRSL